MTKYSFLNDTIENNENCCKNSKNQIKNQGVKRRKINYLLEKQIMYMSESSNYARLYVIPKVFPPMFETEAAKAAQYDKLIILYANKLCKKYKDEHHYLMIRAEIRILGKLLV